MLDTLPARIEALRAPKASLQSLLDDAGFYARDPAKFAEISAAFAKAEAALAEAEENWLNLDPHFPDEAQICRGRRAIQLLINILFAH